ncbi:MAG: AAA family ATPase, partial [Desulfobacterales bacterium]
MIKILSARKVRCRLAAPTGLAAKGMTDTTGEKAATLYRLLEFNPKTGHFQRNESRPIDGGVLIVDEVSMMDTVMAAFLLRAVPSGMFCSWWGMLTNSHLWVPETCCGISSVPARCRRSNCTTFSGRPGKAISCWMPTGSTPEPF